MKRVSLKNYSLDELRDEVERREEEEISKDWSRRRNHYEKKCKHCFNYNPILLSCSKMNVGEYRFGYAWDFAKCDCFKRYTEG